MNCRYYFSGIGTFKGEMKERLAMKCPYRLMSCHDAYIRTAYEWAGYAAQANGTVELLLDSGAFTAWSKGKQVDLDHLIQVYGDIIEKYEKGLKAIWLINLDKIPGSPGVTAGAAEIEEAIAESDRNYEVLVKHFGHRVLPVFHQNESLERLDQVSAMTDYICVSPRNDLPERSRVAWSSEVHAHLAGRNKTHGLATTGNRMLTTVPWYSADSASWVFAGAVGNITVLLNGRLVAISMSDQSPNRKDVDKHFTTMHPLAQQAVVARIEKHGFTVDEMMTLHGHRMALNMMETIEWMHELEVDHVDERGLFAL